MREVNIRFEEDTSIDHIDIVFRAKERDAVVEALIHQLEMKMPQRLTVMDSNRVPTVINENEIRSVTSDGKNVRVITDKGIFSARETLQNIEEYLSDRMFLRISRFELVNLTKVRKYDFTIAGTLRVEFDGGMETWASRRYIPRIREKLSREEGYLC